MARVLFCDIETTGLDSESDRILEVYGRVFDLDSLQSGPEFYWLSGYMPTLSSLDPYVQDMHHKNGLWQAILDNPGSDVLQFNFERFLHEHMREEFAAKKVVLAGRSVQFDRKFLARKTECLHHRVFDLRSIIEFWTANTQFKSIEEQFKTTAELAEHRAKADVINDIILYQEIAYSTRKHFSTGI